VNAAVMALMLLNDLLSVTFCANCWRRQTCEQTDGG
jgi:hypothetical protein